MEWILPPKPVTGSVIEYLLQSRGVVEADRDKFLNPVWEHIHSASLLHDTQSAAAVILDYVKAGKKIAIYGDYDVDGVCATAIVWDFLYRTVNADVIPFIPSRFDEGYGLSDEGIESQIESGVDLIITVDCGIRNEDLVAKYKDKVGFVITDHHAIPTDENGAEQIPESALAVVHQMHPVGEYPFPSICGTTIAWKLCQAIAEQLGLDPKLDEYLDLVALATTCDLMPLVDENRAIVKLGLEQLQQTNNLGLKQLLAVAGVEPQQVQNYHLGFVLGPRINAAGRLESAMQALRLLSTKSEQAAAALAKELDELNRSRQDLTRSLAETAEEQLKSQGEQKIHFVYGDEWPEGVVGLIAGKLAEKYHRPIIVGSKSGDKIVASARSPKGLHLANTLEQHSQYLEKFGGHAQAAGMTLAVENAEKFYDELKAYTDERIDAKDLLPEVRIDLILEPEHLQQELVERLDQMSPFGFGNPTPVSAIMGVEVLTKKGIGKQGTHVKAKVKIDDQQLELIHFGGLSSWQSVEIGQIIDIAGRLEINEWRGNKTLQMNVKAIRHDILS